MRRLLLALCLSLTLVACKKDKEKAAAPGAAAAPKLAAQLVGKWNDRENGSLAWEFLGDGSCKAFGDMDCKYEITAENGSVLELRYNALDTWDEIQLTFEQPDQATWKNLTLAKTDPESAVTKLVRAK